MQSMESWNVYAMIMPFENVLFYFLDKSDISNKLARTFKRVTKNSKSEKQKNVY
jgi:hypothetical protein